LQFLYALLDASAFIAKAATFQVLGNFLSVQRSPKRGSVSARCSRKPSCVREIDAIHREVNACRVKAVPGSRIARGEALSIGNPAGLEFLSGSIVNELLTAHN
jgi:hypothetical protein